MSESSVIINRGFKYNLHKVLSEYVKGSDLFQKFYITKSGSFGR